MTVLPTSPLTIRLARNGMIVNDTGFALTAVIALTQGLFGFNTPSHHLTEGA